MANIASLSVNLGLKTASFASGLNKAQSSLGKFAAGLKVVSGVAAAFGVAIGAGAVVASMVHMTKKAFETGDAVAKMSDELLIGTEKLIGLQHAADLSGLSADELNGALEKMTKSIGEASRGGSGADSAFRSLGLSVKNLMSMTPDQQFTKIADAISTMKNATDRVTLAMDVFGKSGAGMINTLALGSKGLQDAAFDAEMLGIAISRTNAAKLEIANDSVSRMGDLFNGVYQTIATKVAPFVAYLGDKIAEIGTTTFNVKAFVDTLMDTIGQGIKWMISRILDYKSIFTATFYGLQGVVSKSIAFMLTKIDDLGKSLEYLINKIPGVKMQWGGLVESMAKDLNASASESFAKAGDSLREFTSGANAASVDKFFEDILKKNDRAAKAIADKSAANITSAKSPSVLKPGGKDATFLQGAASRMEIIGAAATRLAPSRTPPTEGDMQLLNQLRIMTQLLSGGVPSVI